MGSGEKQNEQNDTTLRLPNREKNDPIKESAAPSFAEDPSFDPERDDCLSETDASSPLGERQQKSENGRYGSRFGWWVTITSILVAVAILLTFALTLTYSKKKYTALLEGLPPNLVSTDSGTLEQDAENLKTLESVWRSYSLYADSMDPEAMLEAAFKAYVAASGDRYAVFYTEAEYRAISEANSGQYVGIGVSFCEKTLTIEGDEYLVFSVVSIAEDSPAAYAGICVGDCIFAIVDENGAQKTISELGYDAAIAAIRGEKGTTVDLVIRRPNEEIVTITCMRDQVDNISAKGWILESDPTVAVVRISSFDLNTPTQFCKAVDTCKAEGATKFVFDLRGNLGGDLRSVKAILSCFLKEGDLILQAIDQSGNVSQETKCAPVIYVGEASGCNVLPQQIGQYRDLDFVVLCDEKTASAAEVFTATLRDFELSRAIVGQKTFGKGIMQSIFELPFKGIKAYIKLTTHSYVTQCGKSYHEKGIEPTVSVKRSEGTENLAVDSLTWEQDIQLQTAVLQLTVVEE